MGNEVKDLANNSGLEADYQHLDSYRELDPADDWEELAGIVLAKEGDVKLSEFSTNKTTEVIRLLEDLDLSYKLNSDNPREYLLSHHKLRQEGEVPEAGSRVSDSELERMLEGDDFETFRQYLNNEGPRIQVYSDYSTQREFDEAKASRTRSSSSLERKKIAIATDLTDCAQVEGDYTLLDISSHPFYTKLAGLTLQYAMREGDVGDKKQAAEELAQDERKVAEILTELEDYDGLEFRYGFTPGVHENQICGQARDKAQSIEQTLGQADLDLLHELASQNYYQDAIRTKEAISFMLDGFTAEDWREFDPLSDPGEVEEKLGASNSS